MLVYTTPLYGICLAFVLTSGISQHLGGANLFASGEALSLFAKAAVRIPDETMLTLL